LSKRSYIALKNRKVKGGFVTMKVDLQKAYARVNWNFLKTILQKFGFNGTFVNWIYECVSTVTSSMLINGGKSQWFQPSRGLRQRGPLSLYLFIICQDVLSRMIEKEHLDGRVSGVKMNIGGPAITHAMYADDFMLFSKANDKEVKAINGCLEKFCSWSSQVVNRGKSGLIFSKLVQRDKKRKIKQDLQKKCIHKDAKYLGAPLFTTVNRSKYFQFLQDKLEARLRG
jgi:hypothetical protein